MRILIVGEFSSFAKELKKGFLFWGHSCSIISWGDGKKQIEVVDKSDFKFNHEGKNKFVKLFRIIKYYVLFYIFVLNIKNKEHRFDKVIIMNPLFIKKRSQFAKTGITKTTLKMLIKDKSDIYLSACGGDYIISKYNKSLRISYSDVYYGFKASVMSYRKKHFEIVSDITKSVIPTHYDYAECYRRAYGKEHKLKIEKTIPLPIDVDLFKDFNVVGDKIIIFLGKMTEVKGYASMKKAVSIISKKYSNIEVIPNGYLSISEYFKELSKCNILIDQCTGFSYGMNTLYGMAMGKCVLSNNEPEGREEYCVDDIPIIPINDSVEQIVQQLSYLIENPKQIEKIGKEARIFVEKYHDCKKIANDYLKIMNDDK